MRFVKCKSQVHQFLVGCIFHSRSGGLGRKSVGRIGSVTADDFVSCPGGYRVCSSRSIEGNQSIYASKRIGARFFRSGYNGHKMERSSAVTGRLEEEAEVVGLSRSHLIGVSSLFERSAALEASESSLPCKFLRGGRASGERIFQMKVWVPGWRREMGITTHPSDRAAEHGLRNPLPEGDDSLGKMEERHTDDFLGQAREKLAHQIKETEDYAGVSTGIQVNEPPTELHFGVFKSGQSTQDSVNEAASVLPDKSDSQPVVGELKQAWQQTSVADDKDLHKFPGEFLDDSKDEIDEKVG